MPCASPVSVWTLEQNKSFESALAVFDKDTPDRWEKVAAMVPGKNPLEIRSHYQDLVEDVKGIDEGRVALPCYTSSSYTPESIKQQLEEFHDSKRLLGSSDHNAWQSSGGKGLPVKSSDQERKKGVPWTEEEHRLFLMGLSKYGKGDWRSISRNFVVSRTPTQVASHAQKYFIRLNSGPREKRRSSIHDITTINGTDMRQPPVKQNSAITALTGSSSITTASSQSPALMYPTSPMGGAPMINSMGFSSSDKPLMQPPHTSGIYDQRRLGGHAPRQIISSSFLGLSHME